jgi:hypothetical protein
MHSSLPKSNSAFALGTSDLGFASLIEMPLYAVDWSRQQVSKSPSSTISPDEDGLETYGDQNQIFDRVRFAGNTGPSALGTYSNPIDLLDSPPPSTSLECEVHNIPAREIKDTLDNTPLAELREHRQALHPPSLPLVASSYILAPHSEQSQCTNDVARSQSPLAGDPRLGTSSNPINLDDSPPSSPLERDTFPGWSAQDEIPFPSPSTSTSLPQTIVDQDLPELYTHEIKALFDDIRPDDYVRVKNQYETIPGLAKHMKLRKHQEVPPPQSI